MDVFELSRFRGKRRRLYGPSRFVAIRSRSVEWGISIDSLVVGPDAYVRLFASDDGDRASIWLLPQQGVEDVEEARVRDEFDSLSIHDRPPRDREPGHTSYLMAIQKRKPAAGPRASKTRSKLRGDQAAGK